MKILQYLPEKITCLVAKNIHCVEEIRLRANKPVRLKVKQRWYYVGEELLEKSDDAFLLTGEEIENTIKKICENSIYTFEQQLINGFLTLSDGTRIGVGGSVSMEGDAVRCFSSYNSLCIRVPHFVASYGKQICRHIATQNRKSCLIIGQPSTGKTTILRELCCLLSECLNVVLIDERGEISLCEKFSQNSMNVDTLLFSSKKYGFENAVRSLSPELIVCDELSVSDLPQVQLALNSGVTVLASMHGGDISAVELLKKHGIEFDFYCLLNQNYHIPPRLYQKSLKEILL